MHDPDLPLRSKAGCAPSPIFQDQIGKFVTTQPIKAPLSESRQDLVLGISIVNYFCHISVASLLKSLQVFAGDIRIFITIVDNSQDDSDSEFERLVLLANEASTGTLDVEVLAAESNLGYAAGNNLAMNRLFERGANLLWVLNPDITVNGTALELIQEVARSKSSLWSTVTVEDTRESHGLGKLNTLTGRAKRSFNRTTFVNNFSLCYPGGHSILSLAGTWSLLKGFDEDYFLFMEEADLTMRSITLGIDVGTLKSVTVHHDQGLTTGSTNNMRTKSTTAFLESTKSRIVFFRKFYPARVPLLMASRIAYMSMVLARGNLRGAKAVWIGILHGLSKPITRKV
ncbi:glycosyltransferase family 2 protein [Arthrobacter sp. B1I2]|uniref:glycosyltransferase family 2 protein n=1 Tax=Arthrobacter sp. B1I2 TaxID=3042263 RepID=UPI00277E5452|nr:hypothetical protein [Arthrobacter sp. B1I2]MDQ0731130.1 N-acetylglucosaminyl-diphospho-decaprenol L-rhamnosyltransferase [Arthrobacter sp. B1I2]